MPDAPLAIFTPPSAGGAPAAPLVVFTPPSAGGTPSAPLVVFTPPSAGGTPAAPLVVFTPPSAGGTPAAPLVVFTPPSGGGAPTAPAGIFAVPSTDRIALIGSFDHPDLAGIYQPSGTVVQGRAVWTKGGVPWTGSGPAIRPSAPVDEADDHVWTIDIYSAGVGLGIGWFKTSEAMTPAGLTGWVDLGTEPIQPTLSALPHPAPLAVFTPPAGGTPTAPLGVFTPPAGGTPAAPLEITASYVAGPRSRPPVIFSDGSIPAGALLTEDAGELLTESSTNLIDES